MRHALALLVVLAACAPTRPPVAPQPEPMEAANRLLVTVPGDPANTYRALAGVLNARGYSIASSDPVLRSITTAQHNPRGTGWYVVVNGLVTGDSTATVALTGRVSVPIAGEMRIQMGGAGGSPMRESWNELLAVAQALKGSLLYARD